MSNNLDLVKDLRNRTGAGFLDCKTALKESDDDLEKAIEFLRKKGLSKASKKSSREAIEGAIGFYQDNEKAVLLKLKSETDFAAKSEVFLNFLDDLGSTALNNKETNINSENFMSMKYKDKLVTDYFTEMIAKIGENLVLDELIQIPKNECNLNFYIHNSYRSNIGKIISIVLFEAGNQDEVVNKFTKDICMHIAAMKPESLDIEDLNKSVIDNETKIQKEMILSSGKPSNIVDKILEGKMKKFYSDVTLLNQSYILDQDKTVRQAIEEFSKNNSFKLNSYKLISLT